jgi:hypothetical protein
MKIIGTLPDGSYSNLRYAGYILEISRDELANLLGEKWLGKDLPVGTKLNISKMYERLTELRQMPEKIEEMQKFLRCAIDFLDLDPVIESVLKEKDKNS